MGRNSILNPAAIFLKIMRTHVICTPAFIQDMTDFLNKMNTLEIPQNATLVSFDVVSLYTSIEHDRGLNSVSKTFNRTYFSNESKEFILGLLEIVLTYLQLF